MSDRNSIAKIAIDKEAQLFSITWGDNEESDFPLEGLRRVCPCVFCRGGHENMGKTMDVQDLLRKPSRKWEIRNVKTVGNYAIQITWSDGHNQGLYRFDALRQLWEDFLVLMNPK